MDRKKAQRTRRPAEPKSPHKNQPLHIPLDFGTAIDALLATKPKKPQPKK